jgi:hypothetical protein
MAEAALRLLQDRALATRLTGAALTQSRAYEWAQVRERWFDAYRRAVNRAAMRGSHA